MSCLKYKYNGILSAEDTLINPLINTLINPLINPLVNADIQQLDEYGIYSTKSQSQL
jgi:flagellar capping protein FliD